MVPEERIRRLKHQIDILRSNNRSAILETIQELRGEGDVSVLPELFNLMLVQEDPDILREIESLLNDLKDKEASEILARAIADPEYKKIQLVLLAACWQNGLSYTKQLSTFVEVVVSGDYPAAVEAFTVIEEAVGELEPGERNALARKLKSKSAEVEEEKKPLFAALVKIIEAYGTPHGSMHG